MRLDALKAYLDDLGIGAGELVAEPIAGGHSNLAYLLRRGEARFVLKRPPLGPIAPSANDVTREARTVAALGPTAVPVPEVLAICEDDRVLGAPFYIASFVEGEVLVDRLPAHFDPARDPGRIGELLVDTLIRLHSVELTTPGLPAAKRPDGYLERQLRRFTQLLEHNATRPLPDLERVAEWLMAHLPDSPVPTLVHGDYRLGNVMFGPGPGVAAVLDWEMATSGDPLADLGYLTAHWAEADDPPNPMLDLSSVTRDPAFPSRQNLADRYAERTGRSVDALPWYQVLALWKAAIFLEGSYGRLLAGASEDTYFQRLDEGVPALCRAALALTRS
jgi:aminoglycoside phosphotransferase (APT) family kinase protein